LIMSMLPRCLCFERRSSMLHVLTFYVPEDGDYDYDGKYTGYLIDL
jgi:hypothetical protein